MLDLFSLSIGGIIGVIVGICATYIKHRQYIEKIAEDLAQSLKNGKLEFKEFLFILLDAYAWKTGKPFHSICTEVKKWIDEWSAG